jgi:hypothetical protein
MDDGNSVTTRLLTLLNVSAVKTGKRKRTFDDPLPVKKLNKRKSVLFTNVSNDEQQPAPSNPTERAEDADALEQVEEIEQKEQAEDNESHGTSDHLLCTCLVALNEMLKPSLNRTRCISDLRRRFLHKTQERQSTGARGYYRKTGLASWGLWSLRLPREPG